MNLACITEFGTGAVIFRLLLASIIGFLIGLNRERKKRGAGTRTHSLVCMSACLVMMTNEFIAMTYPQFTGDITRLGAQVISGMGFIGAGTIIITRYNHVRGLTTAASLWASACIGLAIGIGFISAALAAVVIMLFTLIFMEHMDFAMKNMSTVHDYIIAFADLEGLASFLTEVKVANIKINNIEVNRSNEDGAIVFITLESKCDMEAFMMRMQENVHIKMLNEI